MEDIELYSHRQRQLFWIVRQWKIWKQQVNRQMICLLLIFQCPFWIPHLKPLHPRNEATHGRKKTQYLEAPIRALWYICNQDLPVLLMQFVCSIHKTSEIIDARHSFKKWISTLEQFHQGSRPNLYHHQQIFETITKINAFLIINLFGQVQRATNFWAKDKKGLVNL